MANRFLSNIRINDAYTFPNTDGTSGQAILTDGAGNLSFGDVASGADAASVIYRDSFTGDGTTTEFTMNKGVVSEDQTQIYIDGVYQEKDTYSVSGNVITFAAAPELDHSIEVITFSGITVGPTVIRQDNFTGDGVETDFELENSVSDEVKTMVFLNGVYQFKDTYSVSGTTLSFATAPANTVEIEVITIESAVGFDYSAVDIDYDNTTSGLVASNVQDAIDELSEGKFSSIQLTGGSGDQGTLSWNADEETLDLIQNGTTLQLGQETHVHVKNQTGATIPDGTPVYVTGTLGNSGKLTVAPMIADGSIPAKFFLGVTTESIVDGDDGKVSVFGKIRGLDTSMYSEGQTLFVSSTSAGQFQTTAPISPNLDLEVAIVINSSSNNGTLFVRAQNGYYLGMLHDVAITSVSDKDLLTYNNTTGVWENSKTLGDITTGNITTSGTVDGVDVSEFKAAYDLHNHDDRYYTETEIDTLLTNSSNWDTAYSWGDHASEGYLTSFTETDPIYTASSWYTTTNNSSNWDTAYSWGNHASVGYLTSFTETDPTVPSHVKSITTTNISNWNTAYGWGNHASAGYLTGLPSDISITGTLITGSGASPTGSVIGGVRSYGTTSAYMGASDASGRTAFFGVDSSGYAMFGSLTNHDSVIRADNTEYLRVHTGGYTTISGSARSPIFYDSNNTGYYLDPSSVSNLNAVGGVRFYASYDAGVAGSMSCSNWFRSSGDTGWYNGSYGGGIHMTDSTWVRVYNNKQFYVSSTSSEAIATAGDVVALYSDMRLKTKVGDIENAVDKVLKLSGFYYKENEKAKELGYNNDDVQIGVSAQEVKEVVPEAIRRAPVDVETLEDGTQVSKTGEDYLTVKYERLVPLLIEAIKEQQKEINELKKIIK